MKTRIMFIECKAQSLNGPARIGRVSFSKTGATLYYGGKSFQSLKGGYKANYFDVETGEKYWISGPRKDGLDRLYTSGLPVEVDDDVAQEYWETIRGKPLPERPVKVGAHPQSACKPAMTLREREEALVDAFIIPAKRARYKAFLADSKKRSKLLNGLNHLGDLDPRFATEISAKADVVALLRARGAPEECHIVSDIRELDGKEMPLEEAIEEVVAGEADTLIACVDGRLAYYYGEQGEQRVLLERMF